ncbi:hypothetical protein DVH24_013143 [Malus domestica]|uniref:Uncharacterized protein n=1 Tax=Malus domestica TaxID=3750 RepID=A0A498IK11_MALDO|nr:hypothetical protein DVH24_013143 [Malus domestica]
MARMSKVWQDQVLVARFGGRTSVWLVEGLSRDWHRLSSTRPGPSSARPGPQANVLGLSLPLSMHRPLLCSIWKKRHPSHKLALSPCTEQPCHDDDHFKTRGTTYPF